MNNTLLNKAEKWLNEFGITTIAHPNCLLVNRDDVDNVLSERDGDYGWFLNEVKIGIESNRIHWTHRDDNWLYMDTL